MQRPTWEAIEAAESSDTKKLDNANLSNAKKSSNSNSNQKSAELSEMRNKLREKIKNYREKSDRYWKNYNEKSDKYKEEMQKYNAETEKYASISYSNYSIYNLNGWHYWTDSGKSKFCADEQPSTSGNPWFEAECYLNPNNQKEAALYREFELAWFRGTLLIINFGILLGLFYLVVSDFLKMIRGS